MARTAPPPAVPLPRAGAPGSGEPLRGRRNGGRLERRHMAGRRGGAALIHALYSVALRLGLLAYLPVFAIRKLRRSGYDKAIGQRLGRYGADLPAEPRCWIHAVSVGEAVTSV